MQNWSPRHHVPSADAEHSDDLSPSLRTLRSMDDYRFERFVADLWAEMGYRTTVRRASRDGGIDVLARKRGPGGVTEAVQAKRYEESTTVGGPDIQQYFAMKYQVGADEGLIVTTGGFTQPAEDRAAELGVGLVDGSDLVRLIERHASVEFRHRYRSELGIDDDAIAARLAERESRSPSERARRTATRRVGGVEIRVGAAIRAAGRWLRTARTTLRRAGTRLRGYEPALWAEETDDGDEDNGNGDDADGPLGPELEAAGAELVARGVGRREAPTVGWRLPARSIVPLAGVSPSVRARRAVADRRAGVAIAVVGLIAMLAGVVRPEIGMGRGASVASLPTAGAAVVGILVATGLYSSSVVGVSRVAYAAPVVAAVAVRPAVPPPIEWGIVAACCLGFVAHTAVVHRRGTPTWTLDAATAHYTPVFEPTTVYGLTGSVAVAAVLAAEAVGVAAGASGRVTAAVVVCGVCAVVVDAAGRVVRGGVVGTAAGGTLVGYGLLAGSLVGVLPSRVVVGSDVATLLALGAVAAVTVSITGGRDRVLRRSLFVAVGGSAALTATAYVVARVAGVPQTRAVLNPEAVGVVGVAWSVVVSLVLLAIERRVIAAAADGE